MTMTESRTRGNIMAEYARTIGERLAEADTSLRVAVVSGDSGSLLIGMAEREAALAATEELVGELDLAGLSSAEHAAIIRSMVQSLERSQVAQAALEAELFNARRDVLRELGAPARPDVVGTPFRQGGYTLQAPRKGLRSTG